MRHHYGQLLSAGDLRDDFQREMQLRWWHTVGLHNTWGIAMGLTVKRLKSERGVRVLPGLAYDRLGRELILPEPIEIGLPIEDSDAARLPWALELILVMHHGEQTVPSPAADITLVCPSDPTASPKERAVFGWRRPGEVRPGLDVSLARVTVNAPVIADLDPSVRRSARTLVRPRIVTGRTSRNTAWSRWPRPENSRHQLGWSIEVDTSQAGFDYVPHYFAWLTSAPLETSPNLALNLIGPFTFIDDPMPSKFTFVALFATSGGEKIDQNKLGQIFPSVGWMAIEPAGPHWPLSGLWDRYRLLEYLARRNRL